MRVGKRCGVFAISLGYSCIVLVALVLYIQLGIGIRNKARRQLNGNLGCLGNIQGVGFYYLFSLSSTILGANNNNVVLRSNIERIGLISIICGRLYFQICTNLNLFNVINVICSGLLIFRSLFIRDTGCNRRNSLLDFRITSSYFLRCCRNCLCSFFSHAILFQLLRTRSGSFANSRNDRNLVVLNQCNAEEVRRFIDSTSNVLLASFSRNCKIAGRVGGEVTAGDEVQNIVSYYNTIKLTIGNLQIDIRFRIIFLNIFLCNCCCGMKNTIFYIDADRQFSGVLHNSKCCTLRGRTIAVRFALELGSHCCIDTTINRHVACTDFNSCILCIKCAVFYIPLRITSSIDSFVTCVNRDTIQIDLHDITGRNFV